MMLETAQEPNGTKEQNMKQQKPYPNYNNVDRVEMKQNENKPKNIPIFTAYYSFEYPITKSKR